MSRFSRPANRARFVVFPIAVGLTGLFGGCPPQNAGDSGSDSNTDQANVTPVPVADAGADIAVNDFDENGFELVYLNASKSRAGDGRPVEYEWSVGGRSLGKGVAFQAPMAVGAYRVTLTVFDREDQLDQDHVDVIVSGKLPHFGVEGAGAKEAYVEAIAQRTDGGLFAGANTIEVPGNTPTAVRLSGTDLEAGPRRMSFVVDTQPQFGTLSGESPNLTYTPGVDFNGWDYLEFHAEDGKNTSRSSRIALIVGNAPPTPPTPPTPPRADEPPTGPGLPGELYSNDCSCKLFVVAPDTGAVRIVGGLGAFMFGVSFRSRDELFGTTGGQLYQINPETALTTPLVQLTKDGQPYSSYGIEFDRSGRLWTFAPNEVATIDMATGAVTVRGSLGGYDPVFDPALDPQGKILIQTTGRKMLRFDPDTLSVVVVSPETGQNISGLSHHAGSNRTIAITWPHGPGEWTANFTGTSIVDLALISQAVSGIVALTERP